MWVPLGGASELNQSSANYKKSVLLRCCLHGCGDQVCRESGLNPKTCSPCVKILGCKLIQMQVQA